MADSYGLIELLLVFGLLIAVLVWQLVSVRRAMRSDADENRENHDGERKSRDRTD